MNIESPQLLIFDQFGELRTRLRDIQRSMIDYELKINSNCLKLGMENNDLHKEIISFRLKEFINLEFIQSKNTYMKINDIIIEFMKHIKRNKLDIIDRQRITSKYLRDILSDYASDSKYIYGLELIYEFHLIFN